MRIPKKNAFTLVEIIAVLIILGILAAIALPNMFNWVRKSNANAVLANLNNFKDQYTACIAKYQPANMDAFGTRCCDPTTFQTGWGGCSVNVGSLPYSIMYTATNLTIGQVTDPNGHIQLSGQINNGLITAFTCSGDGLYIGVC